jgi:FdhD protein
VKGMLEVEVVRVDVSTKMVQKTTDLVAEERPLHVFLNRTLYATIFCSPNDLKELAVGHALSEGIVKSPDEIEEIILEEHGICRVRLKDEVELPKRLKLSKQFSRIIFSACGSQEPFRPTVRLHKIESTLKVRAETLLNCVANLNHVAETFRKTGGTHVAAVYTRDGHLLALAEDVGRHNAVDKVIGICALKKVDFDECFLALSGRLTGDIVFKAARMGIPIVGSLSAAIDSGINIAKDIDLTLVGFVRGKRMNVYSFAERILS